MSPDARKLTTKGATATMCTVSLSPASDPVVGAHWNQTVTGTTDPATDYSAMPLTWK